MAKRRRFWVSAYLFVGLSDNGDVQWRVSGNNRRGEYIHQKLAIDRVAANFSSGFRTFIHHSSKPPEYITQYSLAADEVTNGRIPDTMAQKTFHIELRCIGVDDEAKFEAIKKAARMAAKQQHAQAMLVCAADSPPQIMLYGEDFINGKKEIEQSSKDDDNPEE